MTRFNVSEWALNHRSLTIFLMIVTITAGLLAYSRLGRNEDPAFTFRTMVVQAAWPGATLNDTLDQVTDRLERTLKETPSLDFLRSFTRAGLDHHFREPEGPHAARGRSRHLVSRAQERRPTCGTPCPRASSGRASTTSSATRSGSSTASRRTASPIVSCATMPNASANGCCASPTSPRSRSSARRTNGSSSSSRPRRWPGSGSTAPR